MCVDVCAVRVLFLKFYEMFTGAHTSDFSDQNQRLGYGNAATPVTEIALVIWSLMNFSEKPKKLHFPRTESSARIEIGVELKTGFRQEMQAIMQPLQ